MALEFGVKIKMDVKHYCLIIAKIHHLVIGENLIRHIDGGFSKIIVEDSYGIVFISKTWQPHLEHGVIKTLKFPLLRPHWIQFASGRTWTWSNGRKLKINETLWITDWYMRIGLGIHEKYCIEEFKQEREEEETVEAANNKMLCNICCENDKNSVVFPCNHFFACIQCLGKLIKRAHDDIRTPNCPVCRGPIVGHVKIYHA